jgi:hypothetical protein
MGVPSLEMTVLMVFPLCEPSSVSLFYVETVYHPGQKKTSPIVLFTALRDKADSHSGQTSRKYPVEPRARSVGMRDVPIVSFGSIFLKSTVVLCFPIRHQHQSVGDPEQEQLLIKRLLLLL